MTRRTMLYTRPQRWPSTPMVSVSLKCGPDLCPLLFAGVDIPGSVEANPLDKPQLPPINGPPSPTENGRPKTSNPNFR